MIAYEDPFLTLYGGDCRDVLRGLPAESVHCVVTSPPYWGLRDYGVGGQLGLEATPEEYVANMVAVFREVRRVLRADGTLWLNLGDSYASHDPGGYREGEFLNPDGRPPVKGQARNRAGNYRPSGLKPKDLVGIPWRVAFALQADGWYLRSDIIWAKPNPMPESVTDRPTKAHEYLFLLSKSPRYYYDAEAVREAAEYGRRTETATWHDKADSNGASVRLPSTTSGGDPSAGRNLRSVWNIATEPYPGAHFATFPRKLVEPCVKAGTSERGVCPECGAGWVRVVERTPGDAEAALRPKFKEQGGRTTSTLSLSGNGSAEWAKRGGRTETTGWRPSCRHDAEPVPAVVLDPFAGSGTTLLVAQALGRRGVGIDLSPDYLRQAIARASREWGAGGKILADNGSAAAPEGSLWEGLG